MIKTRCFHSVYKRIFMMSFMVFLSEYNGVTLIEARRIVCRSLSGKCSIEGFVSDRLCRFLSYHYNHTRSDLSNNHH
jgi:hypothetical protein